MGPSVGLAAAARGACCALLVLAGCGAPAPRTPGVLMGGIDSLQHDGPLVAMGSQGPARFVAPLFAEQDDARARTLVAYAAGFAGEDAHASADAVLDQIASELRAIGFGEREGLGLEWVESWSESEARDVRTLVATLAGARRAEELVAVVVPVRGDGADESAAAGALEGARALVSALHRGTIAPPARSLALAWGPEREASRALLEHTDLRIVAALALAAGAPSGDDVALLERAPDPLAPGDARPSGIAIVARTALVDVGLHADGWRSSERGWQAGGAHDAFLERGIPAVRLARGDPATPRATRAAAPAAAHPRELALVTTAALAAAAALADPLPHDLDRYLRTLGLERRMRVYDARAAGDAELEAAWDAWMRDARDWLRRLCLDLSLDDAPPPAAGGA